MDPERLQVLLQRYFDQLLTNEQHEELEQMLLASSQARTAFWKMAQMDALIRQWGETEWGRRDAQPKPKMRVLPSPKSYHAPTAGPSRWFAPLAAAAIVTLALVLGWKFLPGRHEIADVERSGIAVLSRASGAVWADERLAPQAGDVLEPRSLKLNAGAVQIDFSRGARVVLEGPADLELISDNEALLRKGKLRATVPVPAHGFAIRTPDFVVTDRGTEFGCSVPVQGAPEVHVFAGIVDFKIPNATAAMPLSESHAIRFETGKVTDIPPRPDAFLTEEELEKRVRLTLGDRLAAWRLASRELSRRPSTLAHLDFEPENAWARTLQDRSSHATEASIIGCERTGGRWPGKNALEFKRADDRVRLTIPGTFASLTLTAWVRVDAIPQWQGALLMSDSLHTGNVHWYLYRDGSIGLGVHTGTEGDLRGWRHVHSQPVLRPDNLGNWVFLASVLDAKSETLTHYFNGEIVSSDRPYIRTQLRLETCEIGNHAAGLENQEDRDRTRRFQGRMDEFAAFSEALSATEIRRIYDAGRPTASASGDRAKASQRPR